MYVSIYMYTNDTVLNRAFAVKARLDWKHLCAAAGAQLILELAREAEDSSGVAGRVWAVQLSEGGLGWSGQLKHSQHCLHL